MGTFTEADILGEIAALTPPTAAFTRNNTSSGRNYLPLLKSSIHRAISSDMDSYFHVYGLVVARCAYLSNQCVGYLEQLSSLRIADDVPLLDNTHLRGAVRELSTTLGGGSPDAFVVLADKLVLSSRSPEGVLVYSDSRATQLIKKSRLITSATKALKELAALHGRLMRAEVDLNNCSLHAHTKVSAVQLLKQRLLDNFSSNPARNALTAAVGARMLTKYEEPLSVNYIKFAGAVDVQEGVEARSTSTKSFPTTGGASTTYLDVDDVPGTIVFPASTGPAPIVVAMGHIDFSLGTVESVVTTTLSVLVDNTFTNKGVTATVFTNIGEVAAIYDSVSALVTVTAVGTTLVFTYVGSSVGSSSRLGLGLNDMVLEVNGVPVKTYATRTNYVDSHGVDTDSFTTTGFTPSTSVSFSRLGQILSTAGTVSSGSPAVVTVGTTVDVAIGDTIGMGVGVYTVLSLTDTTITTTKSILRPISGAIAAITYDDAVVVMRKNIEVRSNSTTWGTHIRVVTDAGLGLSDAIGAYARIALVDCPPECVIRTGDEVTSGLSTYVVDSVAGGTVMLQETLLSTFTGDVTIKSKGSVSYTKLLIDLEDGANLIRSMPVDISYALHNKADVERVLTGVRALNVMYTDKPFNVTKSITNLLGSLTEEGLTLILEYIYKLEFSKIERIVVENLSRQSHVENMADIIINGLQPADSVAIYAGESLLSDYTDKLIGELINE